MEKRGLACAIKSVFSADKTKMNEKNVPKSTEDHLRTTAVKTAGESPPPSLLVILKAVFLRGGGLEFQKTLALITLIL